MRAIVQPLVVRYILLFRRRLAALLDPAVTYVDLARASRIVLDPRAEVLEHLRDYSHSTPTGVYPGKRWKRRRRIQTASGPALAPDLWDLCEYVQHPERPNTCIIWVREVQLLDED